MVGSVASMIAAGEPGWKAERREADLRRLALILFLAGIAAAAARAEDPPPFTLRGQILRADAVVVGDIAESGKGSGEIRTATIDVRECLQGAVGSTVVLDYEALRNTCDGGAGVWVPQSGRVLLLLKRGEEGRWQPVYDRASVPELGGVPGEVLRARVRDLLAIRNASLTDDERDRRTAAWLAKCAEDPALRSDAVRDLAWGGAFGEAFDGSRLTRLAQKLDERQRKELVDIGLREAGPASDGLLHLAVAFKDVRVLPHLRRLVERPRDRATPRYMRGIAMLVGWDEGIRLADRLQDGKGGDEIVREFLAGLDARERGVVTEVAARREPGVRLRVLDPEGKPLQDLLGRTGARTVIPDAEGGLFFPEENNGLARASVERGGEHVAVRGYGARGTHHAVDLRLRRGTVSLALRTPDGALPDATYFPQIALGLDYPRADPWAVTITASFGLNTTDLPPDVTSRATLVPRGLVTYTVWGAWRNQRFAWSDAVPGSEDGDVSVEVRMPVATADGAWEIPDGKGIRLQQVRMYQDDRLEPRSALDVSLEMGRGSHIYRGWGPDGAGTYTVHSGRAGHAWIVAIAIDGRVSLPAEVELGRGGLVAGPKLEFPSPGELGVMRVPLDSGDAFYVARDEKGRFVAAWTSWQVGSDVHGSLRFPPGSYLVRIFALGAPPRDRRFDLAAGQTIDLGARD
jgi:hypothetical protein